MLMNTKYINAILIGVIVLIIGGMGFFGWRIWSERQANVGMTEKREFPTPTPITNKGKESEERDAAMERDVRMINDAVLAYAKDHGGEYPKSDIKNPCFGVRFCLKGIDINTETKRYLEAVPQIEPHKTDYHYRVNESTKMYCVRTPVILETAIPNVFQCTASGCGKVPISESCQ